MQRTLGADMWRVTFLSIVVLLVSCSGDHAKGKLVAEHAVIVHFDYGNSDWAPFFEFEKGLEEAITAAGVGEYDGNELAVDGSDGTLYMYGPDADKLFAVVKPHLEAATLLKNVVVNLRYGAVDDQSAREKVVRIGT